MDATGQGAALTLRQRGLPTGFDFARGILPQGASFARASDGAYHDSAGQLRTAGADVPRFTHRFAAGAWTAAGLLIEGAATNRVLHGADLAAIGSIGGMTLTPGAATAPDGSPLGLLTEDTATSLKVLRAINAEFTAGETVTMSLLAKAGTHGLLQLIFATAVNATAYADFDLTAGAAIAGGTAIAARIEPAGSGVWRCALTGLADAGSTAAPAMAALLIPAPDSTRGTNYAGNGETLFVGALQSEAGARATSRIATAETAATRAADVLTLDWGSRGVPDGACTIRYAFDDGSTQDVAATVSGGMATVPTTLDRAAIMSAEAL